ncbi:MAG: aldehyde dehydrogenase EutE [Planctomycetes bacterium]|nr:aldehyde dehydrogenase EutE [Planctomycetota bacterium]
MDEQRVAQIVERVVARLRQQGVGSAHTPARLSSNSRPQAATTCYRDPKSSRLSEAKPAKPVTNAPGPTTWSRTASGEGVYEDVEAACEAAQRAYEEFRKLGFGIRAKLIEAIRAAALAHLERWSQEAVAETGLGRVDDKIQKNRLVTLRTPGPEWLGRPEAFTGTDGMTMTERAPFGVIGSIIPCTNSTETVINNGISMLSAGNAVVFGPHPLAKNVSADSVRVLNRAIQAAGGPRELLCILREPSVEAAQAIMQHPRVRLVMVTGGGAVVEAAMKSGKRAICAGPGNPPAVVDETADLERAGRDLVRGASLDNNIVCTDEKVVVAVASAADRLKQAMLAHGAVEVPAREADRLAELVLAEAGGPRTGKHGAPNRKLVGKNAGVILKEMGLSATDQTRLALVEVPEDHPLAWTEQLMPVLPLVRVRDAESAISYAVAVEDNRRHTASIHSTNMNRVTEFARAMNCSICVANAPNFSGLGLGGEGYTSFSIATPTGEGMTTCRSFTRERRLALCQGHLSIV